MNLYNNIHLYTFIEVDVSFIDLWKQFWTSSIPRLIYVFPYANKNQYWPKPKLLIHVIVLSHIIVPH
jgi:hypothetical protein